MGFVVLAGVLVYWQVYAQESLANNPANNLQTRKDISSPRGLILAGDGETVLAKSDPRNSDTGTIYDRSYPEGALFSNIVGYWSTKYDKTGIEAGENTTLSGNAGDPETIDELLNQMSGGPQPGNNVVLTVDPKLQRVAYEGLAESNTGRGAAVALDPKNGEVLALATYPSYDPNNIDENFPKLRDAPDSPLINRATQGLYPPGSTFKVITAAAALEDGMKPDKEFFDNGKYETPGYTVRNYKNEDHGKVTLTRALVISINAIFAEIAVEIVGPEKLVEVAQQFGYGDNYEDFPLSVSASDLGPPVSEWLPGYTAQAAFGQGAVVSNVFEMAHVAAAVANKGEMMEPRIVSEIRSPDGILVDKSGPSVRENVLPEETATELGKMMESVVRDGGLVQAQLGDTKVAGKTGTAEAPPDFPHSWWITYAPADDPEIAVAVMVENGAKIDDEGNADTPAIPIATKILAAHLGVEPGPIPAPEPEPQPEPSQQRPPTQQPAQPPSQPFESPEQPEQTPFQPPAQQPSQQPSQQPVQPVQPPGQQPVQPPGEQPVQPPVQNPGG
ncbi:penicillin-binding protein 2 [soil metagenome]